MEMFEFAAFIVMACLLAVTAIITAFTWQFGVSLIAIIGLVLLSAYVFNKRKMENENKWIIKLGLFYGFLKPFFPQELC